MAYKERLGTIERFTDSNFLLAVGTLGALIFANLDHWLYEQIIHANITFAIPEFGIVKNANVHYVAVDVLMTLFFFVIGAELKINFTDKNGEFYERKKAVAPGIAALGGVTVPAMLCWIISGPLGNQAFGIPMATDIAFTLAFARLIGLPKKEVAFLMALAVIDDIIGIVVIALFYGQGFAVMPLLLALLGCLATCFMGFWLRTPYKGLYLGAMIGLWYLFEAAGIHPTLAGVIAGFAAPHDGSESSTARRIESVFTNWFQPVVLGFFAFVSCGLYIGDMLGGLVNGQVAIGIGLGLFIGKPLGIFLALLGLKWVFPKAIAFDLSRSLVVGSLAGIGFTVALFINGLAFTDPVLVMSGKVGIFAGTLASCLAGFVLHRLTRHRA